ncbi:MAG: DUF87 domain-containing protein [Armatimonadetes bacterium]|nr:DUF87 domain-containing protein [Armatimonadota bacterium]
MTDEARGVILEKLVDALAAELADKGLGHCERVDHLSKTEAHQVCEALRGRVSDGVAAFVLDTERDGDFTVTSDEAIELRNRKDSVLCVFVPSDTRDPAASSLGNSFRPFDLQAFLRGLASRLRDELPREYAAVFRAIRQQFGGRSRPSTEHEVQFLDRIARCSSVDEIGSHLWMVGLVPDLGDVARLRERLPQNRECVTKLSRPDRPQMSVAERVATLGLHPGEIPDGLIRVLSRWSLNDVRGWLKALGDECPGELTFERWTFPSVEPSDLETIDLGPFMDAVGAVVKKCGLKQPFGPGTDLEAPRGTRIGASWHATPKKPSNVSRWLVALVPDLENYDPDDVAGVELPSMTVGATSRSAKLEVVVDDDIEVRKVQLRVAALDNLGREIGPEGGPPVEALSIPFWLSEDQTETDDGGGPRRKSTENSIATALLKYALKAPKGEEDLSVKWLPEEREAGRPLYYPVQINDRSVYRIITTAFLSAVECRCLGAPRNSGRYRTGTAVDALREEDIEPIGVPAEMVETESWDSFISARERCFRNILRHRAPSPEAAETNERTAGRPGCITGLTPWEDEESQELRNSVQNYLNRYVQLLGESMADGRSGQAALLCSMDTLELEIRSSDSTVPTLLVLPTHPLKLAWYLGHWDFMLPAIREVLAMGPRERRARVDEVLFRGLQSYNLPAFASDVRGRPYVNAGTLGLLWSVMVPPTTPDPEGVLEEVAHLVGYDGLGDGSAMLSAATVAERLRAFTGLHPYLPSLRIQAINPGRGSFLGEVFRQYTKQPKATENDDGDTNGLPIDIIIHGHVSPQTPAPGLTELVRDLQRDNVSSGSSHLHPTLQLARRTLGLSQVRELPGRDVNLTIATDVFSPNEGTVVPEDKHGVSVSALGLLTRWITAFQLDESGCRWTRYVNPGTESTQPPTRRLLEGHRMHLRLVASLVDPAADPNAVPAAVLSLGPDEKRLLDYVHDQSEWVLTLDRNIGVEFYDYPREPELSRESEKYILDHVPDYADGLGHRLIVTTAWHSEAGDVLRRALEELELASDDGSVSAVLGLIKGVSGRLAMQVTGNPNHARAVVGLALVADYLRTSGELARSFLVPVDPHARLFGAQDDDAGANLRCDLLRVTLTPKTFHAAFIEVKFRTSAGEASSDALVDQMIAQMEHTRDRFAERYFPAAPRPDHILARSELAGLLTYYLDRAWRHGWISDDEEYESLRARIGRLQVAYPQATLTCEGFLVTPAIAETRQMTVRDHKIRVIGRRAIEDETQFRALDGGVAAPASEQTQSTAPQSKSVPASIRPVAPSEQRASTEEAPSQERSVPPQKLPAPAPEAASVPTTPIEPNVLGSVEDLPVTRPSVQPERTHLPHPEGEPPAVSLGHTVVDDEELSWTPSLQGSPHVLVVGSTGSGKSTTVQHMLGGLANFQVPFLVLDFHGDLAESLRKKVGGAPVTTIDAADGLPFSPLEPVGQSVQRDTDAKAVSYEVAEIIGYICGLGEMQRDLVYRALSECYELIRADGSTTYPSMSRLSTRLQELEKEPGAPRNVVARCRQLLEFGLFADITDGDVFQSMLEQPTAVVLGGLQIDQLKYAAVSFVLRRVYRQMFLWGEQQRVRLMVVLDEAHRVAKDPTLPRLMKEGRKFGVGVIVASQEIHDFHDAVVRNAGTRALFRTYYPESKVLAKFVQSPRTKEADFARALEALDVGRAFVQTQQMSHCVECSMCAD